MGVDAGGALTRYRPPTHRTIERRLAHTPLRAATRRSPQGSAKQIVGHQLNIKSD